MNVDYLIKKRTGKSTYDTPIYFKIVEEKDNVIVMPIGIIRDLIKYCNDQNMAYQLEDRRIKLEPLKFNSSISLYDYQHEAVEVIVKKDFGVVVAPPGSVKTIMALEIVARKQQPTLLMVHRRQLFDQWVDKIQSSLGIPKFQVGIWETLDSEEATYIWHSDKTRESLQIILGEIEVILKDIKLKGRQHFLEVERNNFTRVVYDYSDAKKGFVTLERCDGRKIDLKV